MRLEGQLESKVKGSADVAMVHESFGESGAESEWVDRQSRLNEVKSRLCKRCTEPRISDYAMVT